jgi:MFS family permease
MMLISVTNPVLAYIVMSYPEVSYETVQSIITIPSLIGLFVSLAVGPISLRVNKKYLVIMSVASNVVYCAMCAIVGARGPFELLLVAAGISGIARGSGMVMLHSSIGEFLPAEKRDTYIAIVNAVMNGGAALAALSAGAIGALDNGANWPNAFLLGLVAIPVVIVYAVMMPKKPHESTLLADSPKEEATNERNKESVTDKKEKIPGLIFLIIGMQFIFGICFAAYAINVSAYVVIEHQLGTSADVGVASSFFTLAGLVFGFSYPLWSKILKSWIVFAGYAMVTAGYVVLVTVNTTIVGVFITAALIGSGFSLSSPYITSRVMAITPPKLIPIAMSIMAACFNISMFIGPFVLAFLSAPLGGGIDNSLIVAIIGCTICSIFTIFLFAIKKNTKQRSIADDKV